MLFPLKIALFLREIKGKHYFIQILLTISLVCEAKSRDISNQLRRLEWKTKEDMWSSFYSYLWCAMQRSPPILVCNVWVRALANQHRDHFIVAIFCRMMQTVLAFGVDNFQKRCRSAEQKTDNANMTLHAGQVKRNVPLKKECFYIRRFFFY